MLTPRALVPALVVAALIGCADAPDADPSSGSVNRDPFNGKADGVSQTVSLPRPGHGPWGGAEPSAWSPEAVYANAVSAALVEGWQQPGVVDVIVSAPIVLWGSDHAPFGDGQTNAAATLGSWQHPRPPVLATLYILDSGALSVRITLDRALPAGDTLTVEFGEGDGSSGPLVGARTPEGDLHVWWTPPEALGWADRRVDAVAWVRPEGWGDAFPLSFKIPVSDAEALAETAPQRSVFEDGRALPDPEVIAEGDPALIPFERLKRHTFGPGYNTDPYPASMIHGDHPHRQPGQTAVGGGLTWLATPPVAPLKHIYICFDPRQPEAEALAGVPSGAGWHQIGNPAESLVNSLEAGPLLTGWGMSAPATPSAGGAAYGLADTSVYRLLWPGEAFVTASGLDERGVFHWYAVHHEVPICAEIWVHPCAPGAALDLRCEGESLPGDVAGQAGVLSITAHEGYTELGQSVAVIGELEALGAWSPAAAVPLEPTSYPTWTGQVTLPAGSWVPGDQVKLKLIKIGAGVEWAPGDDHVITLGAEGGQVELTWGE